MKTLDQRILELLKKYMEKLKHKKVLTSREEVEANTNETNLVAAPVVAELYNKLAGQPEWVMDSAGKITGYKTLGGADTVFPFRDGIITHPFHTEWYSPYTFERDAEDVYVFARDNSGAPSSLNGGSVPFKQKHLLAGAAGSGGTGSYMHIFGPVKKGDLLMGRAYTWIVY